MPENKVGCWVGRSMSVDEIDFVRILHDTVRDETECTNPHTTNTLSKVDISGELFTFDRKRRSISIATNLDIKSWLYKNLCRRVMQDHHLPAGAIF